jgi:hypothetical protein
VRYALDDYSLSPEQKGWGPGWPVDRWAEMARVTANRSLTAVNVHRRLARLVDFLLDQTEARGYLLDQTQTGAYNNRPIAGTTTASNHSWGIALDLNWRRNPVSHDGRPHTDYPPWLVPLWNSYGFAWGGNYVGSYRDAMHFEFMGAPSDADDQTARALDAAAEQEAEDMTPEQQAMLNSARADAAAARGAAEKAYNAANRSASGVAQIIPAVAKLAADQAADAALTRQILDRLAQTTPGGAALPIDYGQVQAASERAVRAVLGELDQTPTPGGIQR